MRADRALGHSAPAGEVWLALQARRPGFLFCLIVEQRNNFLLK